MYQIEMAEKIEKLEEEMKRHFLELAKKKQETMKTWREAHPKCPTCGYVVPFPPWLG